MEPDAVASVFERARLLDALGKTDAAREAYLAVLNLESTHAQALNAFGALLERTGFHSAARTTYLRAVATHPADATSHANLASSFLDAGDSEAARRHYEIAVGLDPANVTARSCLAVLLLRNGDEQGAAIHARIGFRYGASTWAFRGEGRPIPVLVIHSALGGNVPIDRFIDDRTFLKSTIVAEFFDPARTLPRHALVVNAIGDASRCRRALDAARTILSTTAAPVLNAPAHVARTAREDTAAALGDVPGVVAPRTLAFARAQLTRPEAGADLAAAGFRWPVIIRTPGFQTGKHCVLVEQPSALPAAVAELPGDELLVIAYVDVRARGDARIRKYRVIIIGGAIFPLHLAISTHWMVHYYTADTAVPEHEAEEDAFLGDAERALGSAVWATLRTLAERLGLDYGGIDFALDADGRLVLFEANATMFVPPAAMERRSARRRAVERIEGAMRKLLLARSGADAVDRVR